MKAVNDIWVDLVDKRLWPLAIALLLALIAVPLLLVKPAGESSPPAAPAASAAKTSGLPVPVSGTVALADSSGAGIVTGTAKDPFRQQHLPKATKTDTASTSAKAQSASSGSSEDSKTGSGSDDKTTTKAAPTTYSVVVRYGVSGSGRPRRELNPLTAMPWSANPLFVYLGSINSNKTAVFLVSSDAVPTGDGRCTPNRTVCSQVYLDPGQTEYFDVNTSRGVVQYQLDVIKIVKR